MLGMKRIVIDARESGTTTGRYVDKLIEHLHTLRPEFEIVVLTKKSRLEFLQKLAPGFTIIETPYAEFGFGEQVGLKKQIEQLKPDLVHFTIVQQPVWYRGNVVTTMHDLTTVRFNNPSKNQLVFTLKQQVYKWVNKKVAKKSVAIITPSQSVKDDVAAFADIAPEKITVTYEAADLIHEAPTPLPDLTNKKFIMYLGRPTPHKNLDRLVMAFKELKAFRPHLVLVLAGKKDILYERTATKILESHIPDVVFTDFVSDGQLRWLYENCAAYVFPSLSEGFGLPGLEAMQHGAPVVSSNATCLPEIYGEAAHYFDPLDIQAMSDAINEVLTDQTLRERLIIAGKARVLRYSWQTMAKQTLDIYKNVLGA